MNRTKGNKSEGSAVKTVAKVLDILEHLGALGRPATVSEIASMTGFNVSTAHRLAQTLAHRNFIEQNPETRAYSLGPRLFELGSAYSRNMDLVGTSRPFLEQLRNETEETVHLAILSDHEVLLVSTVGGGKTVTVAHGTGERDPPSCTAPGKVLLADLPKSELERFLATAALPAKTQNSITDPAKLLAELAKVRTRGFAVDDQEWAMGVCCVGVPIRAGNDRVVAALAIAMPRERYRKQKAAAWAELLTATADRISSVIRLSSSS